MSIADGPYCCKFLEIVFVDMNKNQDEYLHTQYFIYNIIYKLLARVATVVARRLTVTSNAWHGPCGICNRWNRYI